MSEQETREYLTRIEMMTDYLSEGDRMIAEELEAEITYQRWATEVAGW